MTGNPGSIALQELNDPVPTTEVQEQLHKSSNRVIRNKWYLFFPEHSCKVYFKNKEDKDRVLKKYMIHFNLPKDYNGYRFGFNKSIKG